MCLICPPAYFQGFTTYNYGGVGGGGGGGGFPTGYSAGLGGGAGGIKLGEKLYFCGKFIRTLNSLLQRDTDGSGLEGGVVTERI